MMEETDDELIKRALGHWANHIETGNVVLSAQDAARTGERHEALSLDQMKLVIRLRELAEGIEI